MELPVGLLLSWLPILLGAAAVSQEESCHNCILIAKALESELVKIEPPTTSQPLFGRKLSHPRSEPQIFEKIDQVCDLVAELEPALITPCHSLMQTHREALEELVYSEGPSRVRYKLCTALANLCKPHALHDSDMSMCVGWHPSANDQGAVFRFEEPQ